MPKPKIQIGDEVREMTDAEYDVWQIESNEIETKMETLKQASTQAKIDREALLERLGITEEEAKLLLG